MSTAYPQGGYAYPPQYTPPAYRLDDFWSVALAALLGSPLAGAVLIASNYRKLGQAGKRAFDRGRGQVVRARCSQRTSAGFADGGSDAAGDNGFSHIRFPSRVPSAETQDYVLGYSQPSPSGLIRAVNPTQDSRPGLLSAVPSGLTPGSAGSHAKKPRFATAYVQAETRALHKKYSRG